jgi:protein-tyrosine-phosphatase
LYYPQQVRLVRGAQTALVTPDNSLHQIVVIVSDPAFMPTGTAIHFVCTGNIYRSRLAEAWCASKDIRGLKVSSSGIAAGRDGAEPLSPWAADILAHHSLAAFAAKHWQRTTASLIQASDVVVFMEDEHHHFCRNWIDLSRQRIEIWDIEDIGPTPSDEIPAKVARTFARIRRQTDALLKTLSCPAGDRPP